MDKEKIYQNVTLELEGDRGNWLYKNQNTRVHFHDVISACDMCVYQVHGTLHDGTKLISIVLQEMDYSKWWDYWIPEEWIRLGSRIDSFLIAYNVSNYMVAK